MSNNHTLSELPIEVLLDNLLPYVQVPDILRLACTSKLFSVLCSDDTLWKQKLQSDFNFSGEATARTSGWKFIYRGLSKPRVFVWGDKANGRLGQSSYFENSRSPGVPFPIQVRLPSVQVVSLVAGGMSFHALDSNGNIHVWGTLDGSGGLSRNLDFSKSWTAAKTPLKLKMPAPIRSVSCGRLHSSCMDVTNAIWTFTNWGRPFRLSSSLLNSDPDFVLRQIECGWTFSSLLTKSGDVFVWWPFAGGMKEILESKEEQMNRRGNRVIPTRENVIPCITWDLDFEPTRLPAIPPLPELLHTGREKVTEVTQLIQIAAFDNHIVGLTNHGHVLKYGALHDETGVLQGRWDYLPLFSEARRIAEHPVFLDMDEPVNGHVDPPQALQITHISAHFLHFTAYSTNPASIVLLGDTDTVPSSQPNMIPALQNRSIISVVMGDYHNAALTADGKLLTWGQYSNGALGLGDPLELEPGSPGAFATASQRDLARKGGRRQPPEVRIPTEVRFDHTEKKLRDRFCFAATAAGWHTGALVIDLEPDEEHDIEEIRPTVIASGSYKRMTV